MKTIKTSTHLLLVDEAAEIKEGDWYLKENEISLWQGAIPEYHKLNGNKIIAASPKLGELPEFETLPPTKKQIKKDVTYNYNEHGQATAFDVANSYGVGYGYCKPCETDSPQIDGECLICGSPVTPNTEDDVEKLAEDNYEEKYMGEPLTQDVPINAFIDGYKQAKSETMFSLEDMRNVFKRYAYRLGNTDDEFEDYIQSLTKPKEYEFVPEMEDEIVDLGRHGSARVSKPKIVNNKIYGIWKQKN